VRNYASAIEHFDVLRDATSPVQAALTTFGFTQPSDAATLYSLGGISDTAIFLFYRNAEPIARFAQFRGKRLAIGMPGTALRTLMLDVLEATGALDDSIRLSDLDYREAIDALIAGEIDVAMVATQMDDSLLQRALGAPGIQLMNVAQAEAIAKTVPGLKHVVLWRGLISLIRDATLIPIIGFAPRFYRWLHVRRINQLHRALGSLERELAQSADRCRFVEYQTRTAEIESAVRLLKVARPFEVDLQRLRIHLRMVQEEVSRMGALLADALRHRG
jgi:DNA-binding transcriptional LysR family regulator